LQKLVSQGGLTYFKLDCPEDLDNFKIDGFRFFKAFGVVDYRETFKAWLRKFPKPIFLVATDENRIIGWVHIDEFRQIKTVDGNPVYVLRAIENLNHMRRRKIGVRLVILGLRQTVGYMITKPMSNDARSFFFSLGFQDPDKMKRPPVDLSRHNDYIILPIAEKRKLLDIIDFFFKFLPEDDVSLREAGRRIPVKMKGEIIQEGRGGHIPIYESDSKHFKMAILYSDRHIGHKSETLSPENPARLTQVMSLLLGRASVFSRDNILISNFPSATKEEILQVHTEKYHEFIKSYSKRGGGFLGDSTYLTPASYSLALLAAGGAIHSAERVIDGTARSAMALVRPPGHHASSTKHGGFCIFNNAAITARQLQKRHSTKKILILDWDAHAANGTQEIFYNDPSVLLLSLHQDPHDFYPHTGLSNQLGKGEGLGFNINIEMPRGSGDKEYDLAFNEIVIPIIDEFKPDFVLGCNGFDAHHSDTYTGLKLTSKTYYQIGQLFGKRFGHQSTILMEGGYNQNNGQLTYTLINAITKKPNPFVEVQDISETLVSSTDGLHFEVKKYLSKFKETLSEFWNLK